MDYHAFLYFCSWIEMKIYCRYQLFYVWEIAFDEIHELGQLTILLLVCAFHFLHLSPFLGTTVQIPYKFSK